MSAFVGFPRELFTFYEGLAADNSKAYWTDQQSADRFRRPLRFR
jgi:hypothetical protein